MHRKHILDTALKYTCGDRDDSYGPPSINLACHAELMAVYKKYAGDKFCGGHDAAMFQVLCKISRIACGKFKDDNYIDGSAYFGIAYECEKTHRDATTRIGGPEINEFLSKVEFPSQTLSPSLQDLKVGSSAIGQNVLTTTPSLESPGHKILITNPGKTTNNDCDCTHCECHPDGVE